MSLFPEDKRAAMLGAVVTTALLFVIAFTISRITTAAMSGHGAEASHGTPPAGAQPAPAGAPATPAAGVPTPAAQGQH